MLKALRRRYNRGLASDNRTWMHSHLNNVIQLAGQVLDPPDGTPVQELTARLVDAAQDADLRARVVDQLTAKAA